MKKILVSSLCVLLGACSSMAPIPTVKEVKLNQFMGDWYVIAHIPPSIDRDAHNAVESYALEDGIVAKRSADTVMSWRRAMPAASASSFRSRAKCWRVR